MIEGTKHEDESDKIHYAKGDSLKLEKFLRQEHEATARIIKQKCLEHSKKCEACDILSRRMESQRESTLIKEIWHNVNAKEGPDGRCLIKHTYVHRHDVAETFPPWRSNIKEARKQAKRVIFKAKKQGNLSDLEAQIEKMVAKGAFKTLNEEEILELGDKPHLFIQYNWVHNPSSQST